jgi:hypothetical protein
VTERDAVRVIAWSQELRLVHERLRRALQITRDAIQNGAPREDATRDLLLYRHGHPHRPPPTAIRTTPTPAS